MRAGGAATSSSRSCRRMACSSSRSAAARLDPELTDELPPSIPIGHQRVCLSAGPIEGEHQLPAQPLALRLLPGEGLKLRDELRRAFPRASSASIRSSSAASRHSSSLSISIWANDS